MNRTPLSTAVPDCNPSLSVFSQRIFNLPLPLFAIALLVMAAAIATDTLPSGMIGALLVMMLLGELLGFAGDRLPIIKTYLGGGAILALFGAAAMVYFGWLPKAVADDV
ncbi:MAG TPA: citrate:sodium symporter, partial [Pseudomonas sp.]|nr:citrate:sodium symporter [Pseudomonas sp.]